VSEACHGHGDKRVIRGTGGQIALVRKGVDTTGGFQVAPMTRTATAMPDSLIPGTAEIALEKMCRRLMSRKAFGKYLADHSVWEQRVAEARIDIEMCRLLCLKAADMMDKAGNKSARLEIAMIKVAAPRIALKIIDDAIQAHGGGGVTTDFGLAKMYAGQRTLRLADGPDEVHCRTIARDEFGKYGDLRMQKKNDADKALEVAGIR
jgi:acyl-CoA dehydrogenase